MTEQGLDSTPIEGKSDVVVVGAGPAGCATGIVLAREGFDVCVVDRARFPRNKPCGDAISNDALHLLRELCPQRAIDQLPHALVKRAAVLFPDGSRIERPYQEPGFIIPRRNLDDCLRHALEASGARLVQHCPVASLSSTGARTDGVRGPSLHWSADIVVAAHGCNTKVLPDLGGDLEVAQRNLAIAMTAYYRNVTLPSDDCTSEHYLSSRPGGGYGWVFPAVDGVSSIGFFVHAQALRRCGFTLRQLFDQFVTSLSARLRNATRIGGPRTGWLRLAPWSAPLTRDGLILCGDAAGMVDPLSGEGIWQALWSGIAAGQTVLSALRGQGLTHSLRRSYESKCWRTIGLPSLGRRWLHRALAVAMERGIYRPALVQSMIEWGYRRQALEMTKR